MLIQYKVDEQTLHAVTTNSIPRKGSTNYLKLRFYFSPDWDGMTKTLFISDGGENMDPIIIDDNSSVLVPNYYATQEYVLITLVGMLGDKTIPTNVVSLHLDKSNETWEHFAPDVESPAYKQLIDMVQKAIDGAKAPYINKETYTWMEWDSETGTFVDTGVLASGEGLDIDTEMSDSSQNAVQNKVVKKYIDENSVKIDDLKESKTSTWSSEKISKEIKNVVPSNVVIISKKESPDVTYEVNKSARDIYNSMKKGIYTVAIYNEDALSTKTFDIFAIKETECSGNYLDGSTIVNFLIKDVDSGTTVTRSVIEIAALKDIKRIEKTVVTLTKDPFNPEAKFPDGYIADYSSEEIRSRVHGGSIVELSFTDTLEDTGEQLYTYLRFHKGLAKFRRFYYIPAEKTIRQIDIDIDNSKRAIIKDNKLNIENLIKELTKDHVARKELTDLLNKIDTIEKSIPTKTSQLQNDSDYATNADVDDKIAKIPEGSLPVPSVEDDGKSVVVEDGLYKLKFIGQQETPTEITTEFITQKPMQSIKIVKDIDDAPINTNKIGFEINGSLVKKNGSIKLNIYNQGTSPFLVVSTDEIFSHMSDSWKIRCYVEVLRARSLKVYFTVSDEGFVYAEQNIESTNIDFNNIGGLELIISGQPINAGTSIKVWQNK